MTKDEVLNWLGDVLVVNAADIESRRGRDLPRRIERDLRELEQGNRVLAAVAALYDERERYEKALRTIDRYMGPTTPPCCAGCEVEWQMALDTVYEALGEQSFYIARKKAREALPAAPEGGA